MTVRKIEKAEEVPDNIARRLKLAKMFGKRMNGQWMLTRPVGAGAAVTYMRPRGEPLEQAIQHLEAEVRAVLG